MNNGLVKERMTYFHKNGTAYQAFNTIMGTAKVLVYAKIDRGYVLAADFKVDHPIASVEELGMIADEREEMLYA